MAKSTDAEMERRVTEVHRLLLTGSTRAEIVRYAANAWLVESRIVDTYIARARRLIRAQANIDRASELGQARSRLNLLFSEAYFVGDLRTALAVQKELNALGGLYPPEEVEVKHSWLSPDIEELLNEMGIDDSGVVREFEAMVREIAATRGVRQ